MGGVCCAASDSCAVTSLLILGALSLSAVHPLVSVQEIIDEDGGTLRIERVQLERDNALVVGQNVQSSQGEEDGPCRFWAGDPLGAQEPAHDPKQGHGSFLSVFLGRNVGDVATEGKVGGNAAFGAAGRHPAHGLAYR